MALPIAMLPSRPQKISGEFLINNGPGAKPWIISAPKISDVTEPVGKPRLSSGIQPLQLAALFAVSGAATPSMAPRPNFSGCLEIFFSTA